MSVYRDTMSAEEYSAKVQAEAKAIAVVLEPPYDDLVRGAMHTPEDGCAICDAFRLLHSEYTLCGCGHGDHRTCPCEQS